MTIPLLRGGERTGIRVDLTPRASRQVRALLADRPGSGYGLRIGVAPDAGDAPGYLLSLAPRPHPGDLVLRRNGFEVFVPGEHADRLDGVRIDFVDATATPGFTVDPPARPPRQRRPGGPAPDSPGIGFPATGPSGSRTAGLDGDAADGGTGPAGGAADGDGDGAVPGPPELVAAVQQALARVRPALQADGGDLDLVAVADGAAYVRLAGACSGCSSALVTLTDLVERVVTAAVPQLDRVVAVG